MCLLCNSRGTSHYLYISTPPLPADAVYSAAVQLKDHSPAATYQLIIAWLELPHLDGKVCTALPADNNSASKHMLMTQDDGCWWSLVPYDGSGPDYEGCK